MELNKKIIAALLLASSLGIFTSCEDNIQEEVMKEAEQKTEAHSLQRVQSLTYGVYPANGGGYTAYSPSNVTIRNGGKSYLGGVLRARIVQQSANNYAVVVSKQDGSTFTGDGVVSVRTGQGTSIHTASYKKGVREIYTAFQTSFPQGITHFYAVVETPNSGNYFAENFISWSNPISATGSHWRGKVLGEVNGVKVYASASNLSNPEELTYSCVAFVKNYYSQVYNFNIGNRGNANQYYGSGNGLVSYANSGSTPPRVGDILCFVGGSNHSYGHVMIITEVSSNQIRVAQQNGGGTAPIGHTFTRSGNTITPTGFGSSYRVQGWMRLAI
jgi:hypothetical protein